MCQREAEHPTKYRLSRHPPPEIETERQQKFRTGKESAMVSQDRNWYVSASPASEQEKPESGPTSGPLLAQAMRGLPGRLGTERTKESKSQATSQHEVLSACLLETEGRKENQDTQTCP